MFLALKYLTSFIPYSFMTEAVNDNTVSNTMDNCIGALDDLPYIHEQYLSLFIGYGVGVAVYVFIMTRSMNNLFSIVRENKKKLHKYKKRIRALEKKSLTIYLIDRKPETMSDITEEESEEEELYWSENSDNSSSMYSNEL
jgi:hypothetical protein